MEKSQLDRIEARLIKIEKMMTNFLDTMIAHLMTNLEEDFDEEEDDNEDDEAVSNG